MEGVISAVPLDLATMSLRQVNAWLHHDLLTQSPPVRRVAFCHVLPQDAKILFYCTSIFSSAIPDWLMARSFQRPIRHATVPRGLQTLPNRE